MSSSLSKGQNELSLQQENNALKNKIEELRVENRRQVGKNETLQKLQTDMKLMPDAMGSKFINVRLHIELFVSELDKLLDDPSHRESVIRAMKSTRMAMAFRAALTNDSELRELAMQPLATERQVWKAFIWRFLVERVFSWDGVREFYSWEDENAWDGRNAGYYIKNIDEIDEMMQYENETGADEFARQIWRRQAIDAVFPTDRDEGGSKDSRAPLFSTKDHPWVASNREVKIEELTVNLKRAFAVFSSTHPDALGLMRNIVSHAVRFNEYMMHEAQLTYSIDLENTTGSDDEFYNNLDNMMMWAVKTDTGRRMSVARATKGMPKSSIRRYLYKVCLIEPALRFQEWHGGVVQLWRGPVITQVKSEVAVGWRGGLNRNMLPEKEGMFHIMAQDLGFYAERDMAQPV